MKKKILKVKEKAPTQDKTHTAEREDAYRQINLRSFEQSFKMLIGHYSDRAQTSAGK